MKILYVSSGPSDEEYKNIQVKVKNADLNSSYGMPEASYKFHKLIIEGLKENGVEINSLVGRSVSHKTHRGLIWKTRKTIDEGVKYTHLFFINLPIIKQLLICLGVFFYGLFWLIKNKNEDKTIIIDGAYVTLIPIVNLLSLFGNVIKISIICDVYSYMADVNDAREKKNLVHRIFSKIIKRQYQKLDGFVFMTEEMSNLKAFKNKPYIVIEGLVDGKIVPKTTSNKYIMYAGALRKEYGIKRLIEGFKKIDNKKIELLLFGNGSYADEIKKIARQDKRIKYMGKKNLEEIYEYERNATILINPRFVNAEFTKYSFPSKNLEYMLSGTPILTGKLPGMPKEYYDYVYLIEDDSTEALTDSINMILKKSNEELKTFGKKAQEFISNFKNKKNQTEKIIRLSEKLINFRKTKKPEKSIFDFKGINKYLPLIIGAGFFLFTILLFIFGPYDWHINNETKIYSFLVFALLFLILGYIIAIKYSKVYKQTKYININKVLTTSIIVFILIYIPTVYIRTGKIYPDIMTGIFNSGYAYSISHSSNGTLVEYVRILLSPFIVMVTPLVILYYKNLNKFNKIMGITCIILTLFLGIACGITKQFADFIIQVFIFASLLFFSPDNVKSWKQKLLITLFVSCAILSFVLYYKTIMTNRVSTDIAKESNIIRQEDIKKSDQKDNIIKEENVDAKQKDIIKEKISDIDQKEVNTKMEAYASFGYATLKDNYPIVNNLPNSIKNAVLYLSSYITHGYKGLSFAMEKDFSTAYGLGFSEFLRHNVSRLFGKEFEDIIYSRTYMSKIEKNGWYTLDVWSSFFIYPASDIGFVFTLILMIFIGFAFGYSWKDTLITGNIFAAVSFFNLITLIFYLSANNQLFQTGEAFVSSSTVFIIYFFQVINRRKDTK